mmetsp:Transcript_24582/g.38144  ORF Transcript_24582/g.38144 Transcript_24582/m.38144 type:complete len:132 (-) Transcript_24582:1179-1574(-)
MNLRNQQQRATRLQEGEDDTEDDLPEFGRPQEPHRHEDPEDGDVPPKKFPAGDSNKGRKVKGQREIEKLQNKEPAREKTDIPSDVSKNLPVRRPPDRDPREESKMQPPSPKSISTNLYTFKLPQFNPTVYV